jgi:hypothetical protein
MPVKKGKRLSTPFAIAIEGKFGQGKRRYRPGRIMTTLDHTRKTAIVMSFLVDESGKRAKGRLFVSFSPASRSLWPLFSGLSFRAYKKNCDNLDVCPCYIWAFLTRQALFKTLTFNDIIKTTGCVKQNIYPPKREGL